MRLNSLFLVIAIIAVSVFGLACQVSTIGLPNDVDDEAPAEEETPRAVIQSISTQPLNASTSEALPAGATPTPPEPAQLPDRDDCESIRGTDYRSPSEREWYLANCQPTPEPTSAVPAPNPPAIPGPEVTGERWILVDIASQSTTAMVGSTPLYTALVTTGVDGWNTPTGTWEIVYRIENETMTSESIGADENYVLEDVLYTQYFTTVGHALHLNYWRSDDYFGNTRSSHGCVGMRLADAEFFWNFATYGTRVTIQ